MDEEYSEREILCKQKAKIENERLGSDSIHHDSVLQSEMKRHWNVANA